MTAPDLDLMAEYGLLRRRRAQAALRSRGINPATVRMLLDHVALYGAHVAAEHQGFPVPQAGEWMAKLTDTEHRLAAGPPFAPAVRPGLTNLDLSRALLEAERAVAGD